MALSRNGERLKFSNGQMGFSYRHSSAPEDVIFVEAVFQGAPGERGAIEARMNEITEARSATQP